MTANSSTAPPSPPSSSEPTPSSSGDQTGDANADAGAPEILDLQGEVCPYTFVRTRLRLEQMEIGDRLAVLVDHEPATRNLPRSARDWGQTVEAIEALGPGQWRITLQKRVP